MMSLTPDAIVDVHFHLGLVGDRHPEWGHVSDHFRAQPQDNLLDVNLRELRRVFGEDHPMFTSFARLLDELGLPAAHG